MRSWKLPLLVVCFLNGEICLLLSLFCCDDVIGWLVALIVVTMLKMAFVPWCQSNAYLLFDQMLTEGKNAISLNVM